MMKTSTNKKAMEYLRQYTKSTDKSVNEVYKTGCSYYKQQAENDIKRRMIEENGHDYRILSHNGFCFTCGYMIPQTTIKQDKNGNTEIIESNILVVDTKSSTYRILCDDIYNK